MKTMLHEREKKPISGSSAHYDIKPCSGNTYTYTRNDIKISNDIKSCTQISDISKKVPLYVWVPRELSQNLRSLIQEKYGKYQKGLLSFEVTQALRTWLAMHTNTQTLATKPPNPTPRVMIVWNQVRHYLLTHYYETLETGQQILRQHIEEAIAQVRGSDPRTIRKWLHTFHKFHLIKPIAGNVWEVM